MTSDSWRVDRHTSSSLLVPGSERFHCRSTNRLLTDDHVLEGWAIWMDAVVGEVWTEDGNKGTGNVIAELRCQFACTVVWNPVAYEKV